MTAAAGRDRADIVCPTERSVGEREVCSIECPLLAKRFRVDFSSNICLVPLPIQIVFAIDSAVLAVLFLLCPNVSCRQKQSTWRPSRIPCEVAEDEASCGDVDEGEGRMCRHKET